MLKTLPQPITLSYCKKEVIKEFLFLLLKQITITAMMTAKLGKVQKVWKILKVGAALENLLALKMQTKPYLP